MHFTDTISAILFFALFKLYDIYAATYALIIISALQLIYFYVKDKKVSTNRILGTAIIVVMGGLTVFFHDGLFIQLKPSILFALIAGSLEIGQRFFKKNLAKNLLQDLLVKANMQVTSDALWKKIHHYLAAYFWLLTLINLVVVYKYDLDTWMNFKLFIMPFIMFVLTIAGVFALQKAITKEQNSL